MPTSNAPTRSTPPHIPNPAGEPAPLLLTPRDVAKLLKVSERTVWSWTDEGRLPCVRIGRVKRYAPADLDAFIDRLRADERDVVGG